MKIATEICVKHLYVSAAHNFFGHHGREAGTNPIIERVEIQCVAGRGVVGDRFFNGKPNHAGQITFFAMEVFRDLSRSLNVYDKAPSVFRRNVITSGMDLNELIGVEFEIQGVRFRGSEECKPCHWMNQAFASGAEDFLQGRGGLRAMILSDGKLRNNFA